MNCGYSHFSIDLRVFVKQLLSRDICLIAIKESSNLFQRGTLGLHKIEVDDDNLAHQDGNVDEVELPAEMLESNRVHCGWISQTSNTEMSREMQEDTYHTD